MKIPLNMHLVLFLVISCVAQKTAQKRRRNFQIIILAVHCEILTPKITTLECFPSYTKKSSGVNVNLVLNQDLPNISLHVKCTMMRKNQRNFNIIDLQIDVCQFLAYSVNSSLLKMFAKQFKNVGVNLENGCPLKKNIKYGIKDLRPDVSFFPPFSPDLNYTIDTIFYFAKERFATFKSVGSVFQKNNPKDP